MLLRCIEAITHGDEPVRRFWETSRLGPAVYETEGDTFFRCDFVVDVSSRVDVLKLLDRHAL